MSLRPVDPDVSFPELEERLLERWDELSVFARSVAQEAPNGDFSFYDGPPFATGLPHYGHLVGSVLKDIIPRYWTMRGYRVERRWGWDCHGLPVENETEKDLGLEEKRDIEALGVQAFNDACRGIVLRYTGEWRKTIRRIGRWVDFEGGYRTMDRDYMESVWWVFGELWRKDLIYQGYRVQPYCPRCGTPLSNFELNQPGGYRDRQDPSVTVRVRITEWEDETELWLWTTTPWTLPSNTAVAVGLDIDYVEVVRGGDSPSVILAEARVGHYFPDSDAIHIGRRWKGNELAGLRYEPLFDFAPRVADSPQYTVIAADFVSTEEGTGVVHMAPAFGEDDFALGECAGLPVFRPVGPDGRFTDEVPPYAGMGVKDADKDILRDLKAAGAVVDHRTIEHSYPHCYRCDSPLLYMALDTWFMKIEPLKAAMLAANAQTSWVPANLKDGRFGNWLEGARDWNFSRTRYWGTPIPIWLCDGCDARECLASVAELEERAECTAPDLHKQFVDEYAWPCASCTSGTMRRIPEVFDCWFESGSMPYAQLHYPFENRERFAATFPADFIAEGVDQTRGWFYTLTVLAAALFEGPAFKHVIVNGIVLAEDGEKMSKRKRNYPDPTELLNRYGADALRLYLINSPVVNAKDLKFNEDGILEQIRAVLLPLWNSYSFLTRYAAVDGWAPDGVAPDPAVNELDGWILSRQQSLIGLVEERMASYELFRVVPALVSFIEELTNWYIRRSRRRFWKAGKAEHADADKLNAYRTLHHVLLVMSRVLAPFLPFVSDEIYGNLSDDSREDSVHLTTFPERDPSLCDPALERRMGLARTAVGLGRGLRSRHNVKVRQPLPRMTVVAATAEDRAALQRVSGIIAEELNVKELVVSEDESALVTYSARPNLKVLGPRYGKALGAIRQEVGTLTSQQLAAVLAGEAIPSRVADGLRYDAETLLIDRASRAGTVVDAQDGVTCALDLSVTPELRREGLAREVINRIQNQRKDLGLELDDRIVVRLRTSGAVAQAIQEHWTAFIAGEVLAQSEAPETTGPSGELEGAVAHDIDGERVIIDVARRSR
ncbi:MAG: isoleucine--tRNA ligase [Planctomycetota bacterium]|nr:MAG: isoleucine--tRNA ligase [Planctomycetota bacterium]